MNGQLRSYIAEAIATFTLTFIGAGAIIADKAGGGGGLVAIALAHGLALSMAIYATGHISGGHVNPAVTIGMLVTKCISPSNAVGYILSQLAGATVAAFLLKALFPASAVVAANCGATLGSLSDNAPLQTILIEAIVTFLLVTTIFSVAVDSRGPKNVYGFAIGLTVCFDILAVGPFTGASMNPARSFGPALAMQNHWNLHWIYWVGPIIGGSAAALIYDNLLIPKGQKASES